MDAHQARHDFHNIVPRSRAVQVRCLGSGVSVRLLPLCSLVEGQGGKRIPGFGGAGVRPGPPVAHKYSFCGDGSTFAKGLMKLTCVQVREQLKDFVESSRPLPTLHRLSRGGHASPLKYCHVIEENQMPGGATWTSFMSASVVKQYPCGLTVMFDLDDTLWSTGAVIGRAVKVLKAVHSSVHVTPLSTVLLAQKWYAYLEVAAPELTAKFTPQVLRDRD
jgi:hypothetical protein